MKIVIDAKGGDYAPDEVVEGAILASKTLKDVSFVLFGDEQKIKDILISENVDMKRFEIVDAQEEIYNDESPTMAIKTKKQSSMVLAFDRLKSDDDVCGMISAGSTGAILTGAILKIGRVPGVSRPSLCPLIPTASGGKVLLIDSGANMDCKPINLCHFAIMGSIYMKSMEKISKPRVALLNVGTEDKKGNELCHTVFPMLKELDINFVGNMEARDILSGKYDVVVADGFSGNVLLKGVESAFEIMMKEIKIGAQQNIKTKLGALLMKKALKNIKKKYDYNNVGGSMLLGAKKLIVKAHGSSKREAICSCCKQIASLHSFGLNDQIQNAIENANIPEVE